MKKMKFTIITVLLITSSTLSKSQNSAIFNGGIGDGWSNKMYAQLANNIFNGSIGDGWASKNYAQLANNIFTGGIGDGWANQETDIILTSITENTFASLLTAYPNPSTGQLNIGLGKTYQSVSVEIFNPNAQQIYSNEYYNSDLINLHIPLENGIYFVKVKTSNQNAVIRVIKQ